MEELDGPLADIMFDAVLREILADPPASCPTGPTAAAVALRGVDPELHMLTHAERQFLSEWLDRVIDVR